MVCYPGEELRKMTVCQPHPRKFTGFREFSGPCQHPLHDGEKTKLKKPKKEIADISEIIYQGTGILLFTDNLLTDKQYLKIDCREYCVSCNARETELEEECGSPRSC